MLAKDRELKVLLIVTVAGVSALRAACGVSRHHSDLGFRRPVVSDP